MQLFNAFNRWLFDLVKRFETFQLLSSLKSDQHEWSDLPVFSVCDQLMEEQLHLLELIRKPSAMESRKVHERSDTDHVQSRI